MNRFIAFSFVLFIFFSPAYWAQNLIDNGGFESYTSLPNNTMQSNLCVGWSKCNQGGGGTPDYFHTDATGLVQLPHSFYATINPHGGNAIMGIIAYHEVSSDYREYISHALNSPLVVGAAYQLSFWISNGQYNGNYGGSGSNQLGVSFTMAEPQQSGSLPLNSITPQLVGNTILYDTNWVQINYTFYPDNAYQHITIGNFQNNANTQILNVENNPIDIAYYFIDDISLTRIEENVGLAEISSAPASLIYVQDSQSIAFSGPEGPQEKAVIYNQEGRQMLSLQLKGQAIIDVQNWPNGIYFYKLSSIGSEDSFGKIVKY